MTGMTENAFINVKNVAFTITAPVELRDAKTEGVIIAQAGAFGGWTLYMKDGKLHFEYNFFGVEWTNIAGHCGSARRQARDPLRVRAGRAEAGRRRQGRALRRRPEGGRRAHSQDTTLRVLRRRRSRRRAWTARPRSPNDYKQGDNRFTGKIIEVTIDVKPSPMSPADKKAVEDAEDAAAIIED